MPPTRSSTSSRTSRCAARASTAAPSSTSPKGSSRNWSSDTCPRRGGAAGSARALFDGSNYYERENEALKQRSFDLADKKQQLETQLRVAQANDSPAQVRRTESILSRIGTHADQDLIEARETFAEVAADTFGPNSCDGMFTSHPFCAVDSSSFLREQPGRVQRVRAADGGTPVRARYLPRRRGAALQRPPGPVVGPGGPRAGRGDHRAGVRGPCLGGHEQFAPDRRSLPPLQRGLAKTRRPRIRPARRWPAPQTCGRSTARTRTALRPRQRRLRAQPQPGLRRRLRPGELRGWSVEATRQVAS